MFVWKDGDLNEEQEAAVRQEGNVFLSACPGSGKTRALTYKVADELSKLKSKKQYVIAITYTHRAADEIHERIERLGVNTSNLWIGTIHSFCLEWILKPYAIYHDELRHGFRVANAHDSEEILVKLCEPYRREKISYWDCGYFFTPEKLILTCIDSRKHSSLGKILSEYFSILSKNRQIDYELILNYGFQLIRDHSPIKELLSGIFSSILIDEYQDTRSIQYAIVAAILRVDINPVSVFVVGDPNQAIYTSLGGYAISAEEFRRIANIDLRELKLVKNYRSSKRIVEYFGNYNVDPAEIKSAASHKDYASLITYDTEILKDDLEDELVRLIRFNIEEVGITPQEVCILAPWWAHLATMTRKLVLALPEYSFDGPGTIPFARDPDNFWYKLSKIALTVSSPEMYVRRLRWAGEVLSDLNDAGIDISKLTKRSILKECNAISIDEIDGLNYLAIFFDQLFLRLSINFSIVPVLYEHHNAFFESSNARIDRIRKEGAEFISDISMFRKVFESKSGITISSIHGIKGMEFDTVIAYGLLDGMVPHFSDPEPQDSANKLLYVIASRARKNLHLISEKGRKNGLGYEYLATHQLRQCEFEYDAAR